jgi:rhodanese-related sulfurtransferase
MFFLKHKLFFFQVLLVIFSTSTHANQPPEIPENTQIITAPEVRSMIADKEIYFIHVLSSIEYKIQHIPGSINIPVDSVRHSDKMPANKSAKIIFYCNGMGCPYSKRASIIASELGYTQIYWFRGGILEWRKYRYKMAVNEELMKIKVKKLSPAVFQQAINENVLILDVRPKWWRKSKEQSGMIKGTEITIPLLVLDQMLDKIPKNRPVLITDRLMRQSVYAAKFLTANGYTVKGVLKGGTKRWVGDGRAVLEERDEPIVPDQK